MDTPERETGIERELALPPSDKSVAVFVDGSNIFYAQNSAGFWFEPRKIMKLIRDATPIITHAFWYMSITRERDQFGFRQALGNMNISVVTKEVRQIYDKEAGYTTDKGNMDIELTLGMISTMPNYRTAILISGDGDFVPLIEYLRANGKRVVVMGYTNSCAHILKSACDSYIDIPSLGNLVRKMDDVVRRSDQ